MIKEILEQLAPLDAQIAALKGSGNEMDAIMAHASELAELAVEEDEILRTIAFFRYINPEANIRLAAGRALLTNDGETAFKAGASATITGNMLTTAACATIRSDRAMLADMGRDVTPDYWKEG